MPNFYIPTSGPDDWRQLLANPDKQWRTGCSAKTLAQSWEGAQGFPQEVSTLFEGAAPDVFGGLKLLLAIPEHKVPLPGGGASSQCDLWCLAKANGHLVSIAVEGKVSESFGPTVAKWSTGMSEGKRKRLDFIREELGIVREIPGNVRYQLLHRTAAAVIEARRFNAGIAVMIVHSFNEERVGVKDFTNFVELMGVSIQEGVVQLEILSGIKLFVGWVMSDLKL